MCGHACRHAHRRPRNDEACRRVYFFSLFDNLSAHADGRTPRGRDRSVASEKRVSGETRLSPSVPSDRPGLLGARRRHAPRHSKKKPGACAEARRAGVRADMRAGMRTGVCSDAHRRPSAGVYSIFGDFRGMPTANAEG